MGSQVKISTKVSPSRHKQLVSLALEHGSTIGAILELAVDEIVPQLRSGELLGKLKRDKRKENAA